MPATVSAIVSLDRPGGTLNTALRLAEQRRASFLVISLGTPESGYGCPRPIAGVRLICFNPSPGTTQGEAEFVGRLAREYHWRSIAVVTITPQASRARLRIERCFGGPVYVVTTPIAAGFLAVSDRLRVGRARQGPDRPARLLTISGTRRRSRARLPVLSPGSSARLVSRRQRAVSSYT